MNEDKKEAFNSILNAVKKHIGDICAAALTSYIVMSLINIVINDTKTDTLDFVTGVNGFVTIAVFIILWICFSAISFLNTLGRKLLYFLMLLSAIVFACLVVADNGDNVYISAGISAIVVFFLYYTVKSGILFKNKIIINYKIAFAVVAAAFAVMSVWMSINTINRYRGFSASNFDFGIFAQLFENMAKHGSTVISVERNEMMSHFFNHFSPIYYVLLPIYMLFRRPEALLGIQAVFITASAFPLFLIGKKMGLKPLTVMFLGLIAIVAPAFVSPMFYDFHENKFLPFFMLWFIYFFMDGKYKVSYVFMLLTLMIKEDAAIYVIFTLIYFMLVHKQVKKSVIGLCITFIYFVPVMIYMRKYGLDFVGWRYGVYFLSGQDKIMQMFQNILMAPGFFIKNVFSEDCFVFMLYMLGSLLFLPLASRDFRRLILLIPFVAINIMTDYPYQHDIGFQYTYGSFALMLVLFADNVKDMQPQTKNMAVFSAFITSFIMMLGVCMSDFTFYNKNYEDNKERFEQTEAVLDRIPQDVSITADTFILPHLYDREELYMKDDNYRRTDYYVLDSNNSGEINDFESDRQYDEYIKCSDDTKAVVYKLPEAPELLPQ